MRAVGFERFNVCGHDRGGRVAYWMALDHPERVIRLAVLYIAPTWEAFSRADMAFGLGYWHCFFLAQPHDLPERLIGADPPYFFLSRRDGLRVSPQRRWVNTSAVSATRERYTPSARTTGPPPPSTSPTTDEANRREGRCITCPVLVLWGSRGKLEEWYAVLDIW